ncbi:MAG: DNA polymerase III subunit delta [Myxococcota bacterium]|jgi:DNA polymerase-3 subunit delta|nr:DNA polymerase III subunit delta [Myxococcota bacterium]
MHLEELIPKLCEGSVDPVYFVHGPERFMVDRFLAQLRLVVGRGPMGQLNIHCLKAKESSGVDIASMAQELPMLAPYRLLIVEEADKLVAKDLEPLETYLESPSPTTVLVLVGDKFDLRRGLFARANKKKIVHEAAALTEREVSHFIAERAVQRGANLTRAAIDAVAVAIGPDRAALDDAVERLSLFVGKDGTADEAEVAQVVKTVRQHSVFELVDAIGNRQAGAAMSLLGSLVSQREEPILISAMIARHVRHLLLARIHLHLRTDERELPAVLGVPPFAVRKILAQSQKFRGNVLEAALYRLAKMDLELKSARRPGERVLEEAVLDLCLSS